MKNTRWGLRTLNPTLPVKTPMQAPKKMVTALKILTRTLKSPTPALKTPIQAPKKMVSALKILTQTLKIPAQALNPTAPLKIPTQALKKMASALKILKLALKIPAKALNPMQTPPLKKIPIPTRAQKNRNHESCTCTTSYTQLLNDGYSYY